MHYKATLIKLGQVVDIKIYDDVLYNHFTMFLDRVEYEVLKPWGECVELAGAEL